MLHLDLYVACPLNISRILITSFNAGVFLINSAKGLNLPDTTGLFFSVEFKKMKNEIRNNLRVALFSQAVTIAELISKDLLF